MKRVVWSRMLVLSLLTCAFCALWFAKQRATPVLTSRAEHAAPKTGDRGQSTREQAPLATAEGTLVGRVLDAGGRGVKAELLLKPERAALEGHQAASDGDGRFRFESVQAGPYVIWATSAAGEHAKERVTVVGGEQAISLRFPSGGGLLVGEVRDASGGVIVGAELVAGNGDDATDTLALGLALSDDQGRYRMRLPPGNYFLTASMPGYARSRGVASVSREGGELNFRLMPAARLDGRVSRRGRAVEGAAVALRPVRGELVGRQTLAEARTSSDGSFEFTAVEPGSYRLVASEGDDVVESPTIPLSAGEQRHVELSIAAGIALRGRLVGTDGRPVKGAEVLAQQQKDGILTRRLRFQSDADGRFSFAGLLPHEVSVIAEHPEFLPATKNIGLLRPNPDEVTVTMVPARALRGRVTTRSGQPVEGASVLARVAGGGPTVAGGATTASGEFVLRLGPTQANLSTFSLLARHERLGIGSAAIADWRAPVQIVLEEGRYVEGEVRDADGKVVTHAPVLARDVAGGGNEAFSLARADGTFRVGPLRAGRILVAVQGALGAPTGPGDNPSRTEVELSAQADVRGVVLKVPARSALLRGRVVDVEGHPIDGAIVEAAPLRFGAASRREGVPTLSDRDGAFVFEAISAGRYAVLAEASGYSSVEMSDVAVPGGDIVLKMLPSATLEGTVKDDRGAAAALATVRVSLDGEGQSATPTSIRCDEQGMWRAPDLRPGRYRIDAVSANAASVGEASAEVVNGKRTAVDVLLAPGRRVIGKVARFGTRAPVAGASVTVATDQGEAFVLSRADGAFDVPGLSRRATSLRLRVEDALSLSFEEYYADLSSTVAELDMGTLLLVTQSGAPQVGSRGAQGLEVRGTPRELDILDVAEGSPAQTAGFVAGTRVLSIDGQRADGIGRHGFETLLASGKSVEVEVAAVQSNGSQRLVLPAVGSK